MIECKFLFVNPQVLLEEVQKPLGEPLVCFTFNAPTLTYQRIYTSTNVQIVLLCNFISIPVYQYIDISTWIYER